MKKFLALSLAAMMLLTFASCDGTDDSGTSSSVSGTSSTVSGTESSGTGTGTGTGDRVTEISAKENGLGNTYIPALEIKDQNNDGVIHVGCLGDSITGGNANGDNWPSYLQEYLTELGKKDGNTYVVHNHGKGGAAVHYVEEPIGDLGWGWGTVVDENQDGKAYFYYDDNAYKTAFDYVPDIVLVQMGTNDVFGDFKSYFKDDYYNHLIKPFTDQGALAVMSTPPYASNGMHNDGCNINMHDFQVNMAAELDLPILDMNRLLWGWEEVFADGLHGNTTGYSLMALNFFKYVFGGDPSTVTVKAQPNSKVTFINTSTGRSYFRTTDANGNAVLDMSPAEITYDVVVECDGFLTYREAVTVKGDTEFKPEQQAAANVALTGTAFDCGVAVYGGTAVAANIIDGELTSGGYQPANHRSGDYVGVEFEKAKIASINIYWETASYISSFDKNGFEIEFKINGEWKKQTANELNVVRNPYTGDIVCDTVTLKTPTEVEGVKITFLDGDITDHKYAAKLYELEVFAG